MWDEKFVLEVDNFGEGTFILLAAISYDRKTELVHVPCNLTAERYRDAILQPHLMHVIDWQEWRDISRNNIRTLLASMPRRCVAVLAAVVIIHVTNFNGTGSNTNWDQCIFIHQSRRNWPSSSQSNTFWVNSFISNCKIFIQNTFNKILKNPLCVSFYLNCYLSFCVKCKQILLQDISEWHSCHCYKCYIANKKYVQVYDVNVYNTSKEYFIVNQIYKHITK